jgi:hypothetical protein
MTKTIDHPFQPGVRVAVCTRIDAPYHEAHVERTCANGNFILVGSKQQYRASSSMLRSDSSVRWYAEKTGRDNLWDRTIVMLWDAAADAAIKSTVIEHSRRARLRRIQKRVEELSMADATDEVLDAMEALLLSKKDASAGGASPVSAETQQ